MTTLVAVPRGGSVELVNRAGLTARLSHAVARATLRPLVDTAATVAERGPLAGAPAFRIANAAESAVRPLRPPRGTRVRAHRFPNCRAEWLWHQDIPGPEHIEDGVILYFHGGGFVTGGLHSHRRMVARLAAASGMPLLNVAYRQLPRAHLTDTVDGALTAYRHLLDRGCAADRIVVAGDSAGGGVAYLAVLAARERGLPLPAGIATIAPLANLDSARRRAHPNNAKDALLSAYSLSVPVSTGFARDGRIDPAWSPVNHDFTGMPPTFIQVGAQEVLLADTEQLARRYAEAGVACTIQIWDKAVHVFQAAADLLPDARAALGHMADFHRAVVASAHATELRTGTDA
ncbi:alpha/beta hydrolase fold domain-containing protein [Nocardia puris]|uniref:alpha/beta hydrolase n=1 Tax=Nocardia puris TaxID=208602 RepID=UPI00189575C2|nr:alpha/beta hydrolase fold domain-containing protein [Nocardia puris]